MLADVRRALERAFFSPARAEELCLFRALFCAGVALTLLWESGQHYSTWKLLAEQPEVFRPIRLFAALGLGGVSPEAFSALRALAVTALLAAAAGFATRLSLHASWAGFFLYYGTIYSARKPLLTDKVGHKTDAVVFVLLILALAPGVGRFGLDAWRGKERESGPVPAWPLQAVKLMLAIAYFGAWTCKLHSSWLWADGQALQAYLVESAMMGNELAAWTADRLWLCSLLSWGTLAVEIAFPAVLFWPRSAWALAPAGLGMHLGMQLLMDKPYFRYFALPYLAFLRWPGGRAPEEGARFRKGPAAAFVALLLAAHLSFIYARKEAWPFSAWRFFCERKDHARAVAFRLRGTRADGTRAWLTHEEGAVDLLTNDFAMRQARAEGGREWAQAQLEAFVRLMPPERRARYSAVALVRRTAVKGAEGFRFEDEVHCEARTAAP